MTTETILELKENKGLRVLVRTVIDMMDNYEAMEKELKAYDDNIDDIRQIAKRLTENLNNEILKNKLLQEEKEALLNFINNEITDEEKLKQIFM